MSAQDLNITLFDHLAQEIEALLSTSSDEFDSLISSVNAENPWFIESEIRRELLNYWSINLRQSVVRQWLNSYKFDENKVSKKYYLFVLVIFHLLAFTILSQLFYQDIMCCSNYLARSKAIPLFVEKNLNI